RQGDFASAYRPSWSSRRRASGRHRCLRQVRDHRRPPDRPARRGPRHSGGRTESPGAPHARIGRSKAWRQPSSDGGLPRTKHPSGVKGYRVKLPIGVTAPPAPIATSGALRVPRCRCRAKWAGISSSARTGAPEQASWCRGDDGRMPMGRHVIRLDAGAEAEEEALRVADQTYDKAMNATMDVANTELERAEALRVATVARAEALRAATVARADALRRISSEHVDSVRSAEADRTAALRRAETRYQEALETAEESATRAEIGRAH